MGPLLFLVYINDIDEGIVSKLGKFADDSKLLNRVNTQADVESLKADLDKLEVWAEKWQMKFNVDKCSVMHIGKKNLYENYQLCGATLKSSNNERDLGVVVDNNLKFTEQTNKAIRAANATLGMIKRNIVSRDKDIILKLYKALVRPKLEYCVQAWRPYLKRDIENLERVQKRATKLIFECKGLKYENRLKITGLTSLNDRRTRGDMIEVFKMIKGFNKMDYEQFFKLSGNSKTRGHSYKLDKARSRLELRRNFFSQRVVNAWNSLPTDVTEACTINNFKNKYDSFSKGK